MQETPAGPGRQQPRLVIVGRVRRAHGVRGEVLVEVISDSPDVIFAPGERLLLGTASGDPTPVPRVLRVRDVRAFREGLLVVIDDVDDRTAGESLRGRYLLVPLDRVGHPTEGEVFVHDLVGLQVESNGERVGEVVGWFDAPGVGSGVLLEVRRDRGVILLPYRSEFVRAVDLAGGRLVMDVPEGMFDQ